MVLYWKTFLIMSRSILSRIKNISDISCRETRETHILCSVPSLCLPPPFLSLSLFLYVYMRVRVRVHVCVCVCKIMPLWANVEKCCRAVPLDRRWQYGACTFCAALTINNTYCFSTAAMVACTCRSLYFTSGDFRFRKLFLKLLKSMELTDHVLRMQWPEELYRCCKVQGDSGGKVTIRGEGWQYR